MQAFRRYGPFAVLIAVQLILVLIAPSRPSASGSVPLGGTFAGAAGSAPGATGNTPVGGNAPGSGKLSGVGTSAAPVGGVGAGGTGGTGAGGSTPGGSGGGGRSNRGGSAAGGARQSAGTYCVTGLLEHPPCVKKYSAASNGGATSRGVTGKSVTVVMYRNAENQAVDAILRSTGTYIAPQDEQKMLGVTGSWVNSHYQLYGRKINFVWVQGNCNPAPPDDSCFRSDADSIYAKYHPFAVFYDNDTNEPAFFDELARKGVITWGGWGFTDRFNNSLRPYHYDVLMGGDTQAQITGEWWCKRMAGRPARYAGDSALRGKKRKVAVVYANTAVTTPSAQYLESIINKCSPGSVFDAQYSSDTSTAASQSTAITAKEKNAGVTSVLWFSDVIAPAYGTKSQASQNYFPEQVIAGSGLLDYDALAQTYDQSEWANAFGPSDLAQNTSVNEQDAGRIWRAEKQAGSPDPNANLLTSYALTVAGGIQAAGPNLTPLTYEYGVLTSPGYDAWGSYHDPRLSYIRFGRGDYTGISDIREVYWDPNKVSPTDNRKGAYVAVNGGTRYQPGQIPTATFSK
ncbi:MAG: hypothetical protein ACRDVG_08045 [Jatrophihabitantaceae bacterium]